VDEELKSPEARYHLYCYGSREMHHDAPLRYSGMNDKGNWSCGYRVAERKYYVRSKNTGKPYALMWGINGALLLIEISEADCMIPWGGS